MEGCASFNYVIKHGGRIYGVVSVKECLQIDGIGQSGRSDIIQPCGQRGSVFID